MKYTTTLSVILIFISCRCVSQNKTYTLSLFYQVNEVSSPQNFNRLDSLYNTLAKTTCELNIYGYADFLNTPAYNTALSKKRAEAVKKHLLQKQNNAAVAIKACAGFGEKNSVDNQSQTGEPFERRVDVCVTEKLPVKKTEAPASVTPEPKAPAQTETPVKKNIQELAAGESLVIEGLSFIAGRHEFVKSSWLVLKKLLVTLKEYPNLKIEIQGHICCMPAEQADCLDLDTKDYKLSQNRAKVVYDYLVKNGIDANRLTYKGYGHKVPKVAEITPGDEQINRRVEIKVLEN